MWSIMLSILFLTDLELKTATFRKFERELTNKFVWSEELVEVTLEEKWLFNIFIAELLSAKRASGAPWVRKSSNLPIWENLVMTWPYTARPPERPSVRTTGIPMKNNSINRYGNPNATRGYFGGKSHSHRCLVKQRQQKRKVVSVSVLCKVLNLDKLSCPQIWNIEQEKDRGKEKVGGRPAKLNDRKGDGDLEREMKNRRKHYFCTT